MALWYECGSGWVPVSWARSDLRLTALLCCPGPSLASVEDLRGPGRLVVALNTAYPRVRPDLWIGMDRPECYAESLWLEPFPKVVRQSEAITKRSSPMTFFPDFENASPLAMFDRRGHDAKFVWCGNTLMVALHLLIWMGARRIQFVGCDFGGPSDYHDDRVLTPAQRQYNRRLYGQQVEDLCYLTPAAKVNGIEFVSGTEGSPINEFMPVECVREAPNVRSRAVKHAMELYTGARP